MTVMKNQLGSLARVQNKMVLWFLGNSVLVYDMMAYDVKDIAVDPLVSQSNEDHLCGVQSMALSLDVVYNHFHKVLCSC